MQAFNSSAMGADKMLTGMWDAVKVQIAPYIWQWYDGHKDTKIAKIAGIYTVTYGSFGIAERLITAIFAPRAA